jgi:nucleotide-binding universal stress UspA family protein
MTLVVPFDGSQLAEAALVRASQFGSLLDEPGVAVTAIPDGDTQFARRVGVTDEPTVEAVADHLESRVRQIAPTATFRAEAVGKYAPSGQIAKTIRRAAKDLDASMVFIGSENAGRIVRSLGSVGGSVATDEAYDVVIVRGGKDPQSDHLDADS